MHAKANTEVTLRMSEAQAHHLNGLARQGRQLVIDFPDVDDCVALDDDVIATLDKISEWLSKVLP